MKYKCVIVDNEPPSIKILKNYIEGLENLEVAGTCNNAIQAIEILLKEKIDLVFLDDEMLNLPNMELIKNIQYPPKIIFTTTQKSPTIESFEPYVIDYLPKPFSFELFLKAVIRFCHSNNAEKADTNCSSSEFLYFRADRKMVKVIFDDISYIESFKDYVVIHKQNDAALKVKYTISNVENMLPHHLFLRIHRSYIVSIKKVTAFTNNDVEIGKIELPIGKSYPDVFRKLTRNNFIVSNED